MPQARAGLLPNVALPGQANVNNTTRRSTRAQDRRQPRTTGWAASRSRRRSRCTVRRTWSRSTRRREQVTQSDFTLAIAQQDLIIRTTVAYFDVLLAEFNVELAEQQKLAVAEQLAQAKRNFEVGTATITDTNEAQAKYDQIIATEIQARNDLDRRRTALARDHRPDARRA